MPKVKDFRFFAGIGICALAGGLAGINALPYIVMVQIGMMLVMM